MVACRVARKVAVTSPKYNCAWMVGLAGWLCWRVWWVTKVANTFGGLALVRPRPEGHGQSYSNLQPALEHTCPFLGVVHQTLTLVVRHN